MVDENTRIKKIEGGPLQKFKNQNLLLKNFGKEALAVYSNLKGSMTVKELSEKSGVDVEKVKKIVEFMLKKGMCVSEEFSSETSQPSPSREVQLPSGEGGGIEGIEITPEGLDVGGEITPEETPSSQEEEGGVSTSEELTPVEKIIYDKYGKIGLEVYNRIDGVRTAEQIMKEVGISEEKLVEILNFLEEKGIIKLEHPTEKKEEEEKLEEEKFAPMVGGLEEEEVLPEKELPPIYLPLKNTSSVIASIKARASLLVKYGKVGGEVFDAIDGKKDVIQISKELKVPLYVVEEILRDLEKEGIVVLKPLTRKEIKKRYGEDAYTVFKKYGKYGVALYELIGGDMSLKEMADMLYKNKEDKKNIVEIFLFIHKVLGLELPVDKELLYKKLGLGST